MRFLLALFALLVLTGCRWESDTYCDPREKMLPVRPDEETMFYQHEICKLVNEYATKLEWYHQVWLEHCYAEFENDKFNLYVDFSSQANLNIPEARKMTVRIIESLLDHLNENELLVARQESKFTPENLYFNLTYTSFYGKYVDSLLVGRSELKYGFLNVFYAHDAFMVDPVIYHKHSEPYETSKCIVATQDKTDKKLKPTPESIYDRIVAPQDWMSGDPDYVRRPPGDFDAYELIRRGTMSNYPRYGIERASGAIETTDVWPPEQKENDSKSQDESKSSK
jgi:hypothetical protein